MNVASLETLPPKFLFFPFFFLFQGNPFVGKSWCKNRVCGKAFSSSSIIVYLEICSGEERNGNNESRILLSNSVFKIKLSPYDVFPQK